MQDNGWRAWVGFFIGTPRRFLWSFVGILVILAAICPDLAARAMHNVLGVFVKAVGPFVGPLLTILIIAVGFWVMLRPFIPKKKKRREH